MSVKNRGIPALLCGLAAMVQIAAGASESAAQLINQPTPELAAYLASAKRMTRYECRGKTYALAILGINVDFPNS